jgi:TonB family protein
VPTSPTQFRRRFARFSVAVPMTVISFRASAVTRFAGRSVEIGGGGLRGAFPTDLQPGERVELEFALPPSPNTLRFPLVVRHCQGSEYGFEFLSLKRNQQRALDALQQHATLGLVPIINIPEHAGDIAAPQGAKIIVCPSCGSEYTDDKVICFNCGTTAQQPAVEEPPPPEEKPLKLFRQKSWVRTWAPSYSTSTGPMGADALIALLFVLTLAVGLWQWLNTPSADDQADHRVNISFSDALIALDPLPKAEAPAQKRIPVSSSEPGRRKPSGAFVDLTGSSSDAAAMPSAGGPSGRRTSPADSRATALSQPNAAAPKPATASSGPGMLSSALSGSAQAAAALPAAASNLGEEHWRGAGLQLLEHIVPRYPALAASERLQGQVVLVATISKDGRVADVRPVSGPAVLASSAVDAVRQWRFRPYEVDGKPVQVQTNIRVNFNLDK